MILALVYLGSALVYEYRFIAAAAFCAPPLSRSRTWPARPLALQWVAAAALATVLPLAYLMVRGMSRSLYDEADAIGLSKREQDRRISELVRGHVDSGGWGSRERPPGCR